MAKTTFKVVSYYDGTQDMQNVLIELIIEKIREKDKIDVDSFEERDYNLGVSYDDPPRLAR